MIPILSTVPRFGTAAAVLGVLALAAGAAPKDAASSGKTESVTIVPEPLHLKTGAPLSTRALVSRPPFVKGLRSWTLETRRHHGYIVTKRRRSGRCPPRSSRLAMAGKTTRRRSS